MAAVKETDGAYVTVTDEEILAAIPALARGSGVFAEPAGGGRLCRAGEGRRRTAWWARTTGWW